MSSELQPYRAADIVYRCATGARDGEAQRARRGDVDFATRLVVLHGTKTVASNRSVPITTLTEGMLRWSLARAPGRDVLFEPWQNLLRDLKAACARLRIPPCSTNDLRRSFGQLMRAAGVDTALLAAMLGHTDARLVQTTYGKVQGEELRQLVEGRIEGHRYNEVERNIVPNLYRSDRPDDQTGSGQPERGEA